VEQNLLAPGHFYVPEDAAKCDGEHRRLGTPLAVYEYRDSNGLILCTAHYEKPGELTQVVVWLWSGTDWVASKPHKGRPLYRLDRLQKNPRSPVLIVSDEAIVEAVQRVLSGTIVTTWCGGRGQSLLADWSALKGRMVTIWPTVGRITQDDGRCVAARMLEQETFLDTERLGVKLIDVSGQPDGWNLQEAINGGWTKHDIVTWGSQHRRSITPDGQAAGMLPSVEPMIPVEEYDKDGSISSGVSTLAGLTTANGVPHPNLDNVLRVFEASELRFKGVYYDEFLQKVIKPDGEWTEIDDMITLLWLQRECRLAKITLGVVNMAMNVYAYQRRRNECKTWIESLDWDNQSRLQDLLPVGFGTARNPYTESVGRCFIMGMVARVLQPGCKVDNMPVFEGRQGSFKSTALRILGDPYFTEQHEKVTSKDFYLVLRGKMLVEISELSAFKGALLETVKGVASNQVDNYRAPYERRSVDHRRQCVFAATTNSDDWNTDDTGARRFWPVACGTIDLAWIREHRDALLAEAVSRVQSGESWHDVPQTLAQKEQEMRHEGDVFDEALAYYLSRRPVVTIKDCLLDGLGMEKAEKWDKQTERRITGVLRRSGYIRSMEKIDGRQTRVWRKPDRSASR
jgi:hypothetical protein